MLQRRGCSTGPGCGFRARRGAATSDPGSASDPGSVTPGFGNGRVRPSGALTSPSPQTDAAPATQQASLAPRGELVAPNGRSSPGARAKCAQSRSGYL